MPNEIKDIFEENELKLEAKIVRGKWKGTPSAKFIFIKDGKELPPVDGEIDGDVVRCKFAPPKVDDEAQRYVIQWRVEAEDQKIFGSEDFYVWPKNTTITFFTTDAEKNKVGTPGIPFRVMQKGVAADTCVSWPPAGSIEYKFKDPGASSIECVAPYSVVEWTKGAEDKGRTREVTVVSNFKADFVEPHSADSIHQFVNLTTASGKAGRDGKGHVVEIIVGAAGDSGRSASEKLGKPGARVYIKCTFTVTSKRTDPKPELSGALEIKKTADLKTQTGSVALGADGTAKFAVNLGLAGGESCEIKIGGTSTCEDATLKLENWRTIYYQMTLPKGMAAPDFTSAKAAFAKVKVTLEEYEKIEYSDEKPPGAWVDGVAIGETEAKALVIGDHDDFYKALFKDTKSPQGCHVIFCHGQFDGGKPHHKSAMNATFNSGDSQLAGGKLTFNWHDIDSDTFLLPASIQTGNHPLLNGTWSSDGESGAIGSMDMAITYDESARGKVVITLPGPAAAKVTAGKSLKVTLSVMVAKGPYLGWCTGKHIVIKTQPVGDMNKTLVHEIGHAFNMIGKNAIPGLDVNDHKFKYTGRGHQGGHCAKGCDEVFFKSGADLGGRSDCTCVMFGEGSTSTTAEFCDLCEPFALGESIQKLGN